MKTLRNLCMTAVLAIALMLIPGIASVQVQAEGTDNYIDYAGETVNFIKDDGTGFGMFTAQEGTTIALDGDNVVIHYLPKNTTVYGGIHWGLIGDKDPVIDVPLKDGAMDITLPKSVCGKGIPVAPLKPAGGTTSVQYYLAIPSADTLPTMRELTRTELAITNETGMFKAVSAFIEKDSTGTYLIMALSGTGYHNLYKGTYEEAVANGDNRGNWIAGYENADKKWEFEILTEDESYIPLVAISQSYVDKYEAGTNPLARAFYPRQITLDLDAKTIVTADYQNTVDLALTNEVKMFKPSSASLSTIGGPNSNNYKVELNLTMENDSYNAIFLGEGRDVEDSKIVELAEGNIFKVAVEIIKEYGKLETIESILENPAIISFRSKKNGTWYDREVTISKTGKTIVFKSSDADYSAVDAAIATIPEDLSTYTDDSIQAVQAAKEAVIKGINYNHQDEVDAMAAAINEAVANLKIDDHKVAQKAQDLIDAAKTDYATAAEKQAAVDAAKAAYDALTPEQKALIPDPTADLEEAQKAADTQKADEDKKAAQATQDLIDKAKADYATAAEKQAAIDAAKASYEALSPEQKALIPDANKEIEEAQKAADAQKAAEEKAKKEVPVGTQATVGGLVYKTTSKTAAALVKPSKKTLTKVAIPATVKIQGQSFKVTAIQAKAFKKNTKLKTLTIGANVKYIGASAFEGCTKIAKITIPAAVTTIGNKAFYNCKKATKLVIKGTAIKTFGKKSFAKTGIKKLTAPKKKKAAYKKKLIKAGLKKTVK